MSPRSVVVTVISAILAITVVGCGRASTAADAAVGSVYRVEIEPCLGLSTQRATAFAVIPPESADPGDTDDDEEEAVASGSTPVGSGSVVLVTAAHSLDQASGAVVRDEQDGMRPAAVLFLDPARDIAVLEIESDIVDGADDRGFTLTEPAPDIPIRVVTFADIEGPADKTGTVARLVNATLDGEGRRKAIELVAIDIDPGDSGAPVVNGNGDAVAMVFAAARADDRAWAVAASELRDAVAVALDPTTAPSGLSCTRDRSGPVDAVRNPSSRSTPGASLVMPPLYQTQFDMQGSRSILHRV